MTKIEDQLDRLWSDVNFDEGNFISISQILKKRPSYVDFFVKKIDKESIRMGTLYLIIIDIVPLEFCIKHALEKEDWLLEDFSEFDWFTNIKEFKPITDDEYRNWLEKQKFIDERK